ncbi:MAG: hypothetical protein R2791_07290 [Saprospiraceae bacterium]
MMDTDLIFKDTVEEVEKKLKMSLNTPNLCQFLMTDMSHPEFCYRQDSGFFMVKRNLL